MFEQMKWEDVYSLWDESSYNFSKILSAPMTAEPVFVEYNQKDSIYGFDWLQNEAAQARKALIEKNPLGFLYLQPTNKGTIQTAEMLINAQSEEELAAIWIAATAKELLEYWYGNGIGRYARMLYMTACEFLKTRYYLWHHAMKKLVPEILIPLPILENIDCKDAAPVMGLIQMNTVLLKSSWRILRYSSLKDEELPESCFRIRGRRFEKATNCRE
ncbi:MAG: hypothetical protein MRZ54_02955 [Clostridiales bacterium]|nr:hypothetical protein [Clostridiales bacterium]